MAFNERLALLITADYQNAVRGIEATGKAADKELGRAESKTAKFGATATKVGAGMVGFGAIVGAGLFKAAQASEEANLSTVKLQNTINNMPKLAGASTKAFTDLADAIQDKTAADADAIVEGQALLGTFSLTAKEIQGITPLVVDYARKFGTDIPSAAIQVGKALDGQVGALKRNGVSIDEVLFKTDRYRAVQEALRAQVGGFAEQEGATLSGRLQRLKNELGDVEEGVGAGVGGAFSAALTPIEKATGAFGDLDPAIQSTVGRVGTIAAATTAGVGGLSLLAGTVARAHDRFTLASGGLSRFGKVAAGLGAAGAIAGLVSGLSSLAHELNSVAVNVDELSQLGDRELVDFFRTVSSLPEGVIRAYEKMDKATLHSTSLVSQATGAAADRGRAAFRELAEGSESTAQRVINAMRAQGLDTKAYEVILADVAKGHRIAAADAQRNASALGEVSDETAEAEGETFDLAKAQKEAATAAAEHAKALEDQKEMLEGLLDGTLEYLSAQIGLAEAENGVRDALNTYNDALKEHGPESAEANAALLRLKQSYLDAAQASVESADAQRRAHGQAALTTQEKVQIQVDELERLKKTLDPKSPLRKELDAYIATLKAVPTDIETVVGITYEERNKIPPTVKTVEDQQDIAEQIPLPPGTTPPNYQAPPPPAPQPPPLPANTEGLGFYGGFTVINHINSTDPVDAGREVAYQLYRTTYLAGVA